MAADPFGLERFRRISEAVHLRAMAEIRAGHKETHWIWFVFPQLRGLGHSWISHEYGLAGVEEARAFLADAVLRQRLLGAVHAMLGHVALGAGEILGELDALKFRSCLTLVALADPGEPVFTAALERFFDGRHDALTLQRLAAG